MGRSGASLGRSWALLGRFFGVQNQALLKDSSKMGSKRPSGSIWGRFWEDLGGSWEDLGQILGGFWEKLGKNLEEYERIGKSCDRISK